MDGSAFYCSEVPPGLARTGNEWRLIRATEARLEQPFARELRPDVIHAHSPVLNAIPAIRLTSAGHPGRSGENPRFWEDAAR